MITGDLKSRIDKVWEAFWTGGLANPITIIEQMTYLLFIRRLDELQTQKESKANLLKKPIEDPLYSIEENELRRQVKATGIIKDKYDVEDDGDGAKEGDVKIDDDYKDEEKDEDYNGNDDDDDDDDIDDNRDYIDND